VKRDNERLRAELLRASGALDELARLCSLNALPNAARMARERANSADLAWKETGSETCKRLAAVAFGDEA